MHMSICSLQQEFLLEYNKPILNVLEYNTVNNFIAVYKT